MTLALDRAAALNLTVAVAVADSSGELVCFQRMDGTQLGSTDVAILKARCAVRFKRSTAEWAVRARDNPGILSIPGVIAVLGGIPIVRDEKIVGGIGVSGALPEQDDACARAGVEPLAANGKAAASQHGG
jgi:uncharacterized protein GlcG (DUF336 family)